MRSTAAAPTLLCWPESLSLSLGRVAGDSSSSLPDMAAAAPTSKLGCVVVAVDGSEESMNALRWGLQNLRLRSQGPEEVDVVAPPSETGGDGDGSSSQQDQQQPPSPQTPMQPGTFLILHVQSPPSIAAGLNPGAIPFGGPSHVEVPAFTAAIEAHQRRISEAIIAHALRICAEKNANVKTQVVVGDPKELICEVTTNSNADLLVMGCRDCGPIKRMFLGSVSNYCVNNVRCPVVVIKGTSQV